MLKFPHISETTEIAKTISTYACCYTNALFSVIKVCAKTYFNLNTIAMCFQKRY